MQGDIERILFEQTEIQERIRVLAEQITSDYLCCPLTVLAVMSGALVVAADLIRQIPLPLQLGCISASSYGNGAESSGKVVLQNLKELDIAGRHVLIVDDILDTGNTLRALQEELQKYNPLSIKSCFLLRKLKSRTVHADYVGFEIANDFVVGYGLDYQERYRNLPFIGVLSLQGLNS